MSELTLCLDCPLWGHHENCPAHWDGAGETCHLLSVPGVRHAVLDNASIEPTPEHQSAFRDLLDRARILGSVLGTSVRDHNQSRSISYRYRGFVKVLPPQESSFEWFFGTVPPGGFWLPYSGYHDNILYYELKQHNTGARYAVPRAGYGISSIFASVEVRHRVGDAGHSQGLASVTLQWYNHIERDGTSNPRDGRLFWSGDIPLQGSSGAANGFPLFGGIMEPGVVHLSMMVLF